MLITDVKLEKEDLEVILKEVNFDELITERYGSFRFSVEGIKIDSFEIDIDFKYGFYEEEMDMLRVEDLRVYLDGEEVNSDIDWIWDELEEECERYMKEYNYELSL